MAAEFDDPDRIQSLAAELVAGDLAESIAQTDLPPEYFVAKAAEGAGEIQDLVLDQREGIEELRTRLVAQRRRLRGRAIGLAAAAATASLGIISISPLVSGLLLIAIALGLIGFLAFGLRSGRGGGRERTALELDGAERASKALLGRAVYGWLTEQVDLALGEIYATSLPAISPEGLAEIDDSDSEIATAAAADLESLVDAMPGGSIGISGPRGAGKTTLLKRVTTGAGRRESKVVAGIVVDAPVDYDAREFVLHLFARLCEAVLGPERVDGLRGWDRHFGAGSSPRLFSRLGRGPLLPRLGMLLIGAGTFLYLAVLGAQGEIHLAAFGPLALAISAAGLILTLISFALDPSRSRRWILAALGLAPGAGQDLVERAEQRLLQIWFQRTRSSGWSGAFKVPFGLEAGGERSTQLAENQLGFPDVVALYKEFVRILAEVGQVRIGIDELDKMDDERARRFLNEIKVIFRISGCFYLVSVSEDAMSYFERRGLPFRDVFDSSFDEVQRVGYLSYADSHRVLRRRVAGLPIQFVALCHILGGGLARDVIRVARDVCEREQGVSIDDVTAELCTRQLRSKCAAAQVAVRRLKDPLHVTLLSRWLRAIDLAAPDVATLVEMCQAFGDGYVAELGPPPVADAEALAEHREALSIALEIVTFAYFIATLTEFMPTLTTEAETKAAVANSVLDGLAQARQAFAVNPAEAWEALSRVRDHPLAMTTIAFPSLRVATEAT